LSTGIGGGVIIDGKLLRGAQGLAGELGHMAIETGSALCGCGQPGHVEALASGPAIARLAQSRLEAGELSILVEMVEQTVDLTAADVALAARKGDTLAREVLEEAGSHIGRHLANLAHAFNPEAFVLGGGVSRIGDLIFEPIERAMHAYIMHPAFLEGLRLLPAKLGDNAGLVGAVVLANQA
jgi:glucokinase